MNGIGETAQQTKGPCGISSIIPLGMSCRDRAEAFARRLQSKLRTLGSQDSSNNDVTVDESTCLNQLSSVPQVQQQQQQELHIYQQITRQQDDRVSAETSSCYNYEIELASPASPTEELEYRRLFTAVPIASSQKRFPRLSPPPPLSSPSSTESCVSDLQFFDPESSEGEQRSQSLSVDYHDCVDSRCDISENVQNGRLYPMIDSDSCSESLPNSQSTTSISACTPSSSSNYTLQDETLTDLCFMSKAQFDVSSIEPRSSYSLNGHCKDLQELEEFNESFYKRNLDLDTPFLLNNQHLTDSPTPETSPEPDDIDDKKEQIPIVTNQKEKSEDEDDFPTRPPRLRRCSSLKTGKTPPGTPSRKKIVRFADVLGLDLADVKTFLDEVPVVPKSAYEDLEVNDQLEEAEPTEYVFGKVLVPLFEQPGGRANFIEIVRKQQVCLENAVVSDSICLTITGCVRVRNLDFNKSVHLRYTLDGWKSFADFQANYIENSCDGFSDKFNFTIYGNSLQIGQRLEMAVRFSCKGQQYWDNNFGINYCFKCVSPSMAEDLMKKPDSNALPGTFPSPRNSWDAAFY